MNFMYYTMAFSCTLCLAMAFEFNADIEKMLRAQREQWIQEKSEGKLDSPTLNADKSASLPPNNVDLEYFLNYTSLKQLKSSCTAGKPCAGNPRTRKEYRCLTTTERNGYHSALRSLKTTVVGAVSKYDNIASKHKADMAISGHFGPSFGPWHREYLATIERFVQQYCPTCTLPYWDTRLDKRAGGNPADSVMFSPLTFGNAVGAVTSGFAANWTSYSPECGSISPTLKRDMLINATSFYDDKDVAYLDGVTKHEQISYPWSPQFELAHGYVHMAFGAKSHMSNIACSPTDPIFISHHCFVDLLFEKARTSIAKKGKLLYADTTKLPKNFNDNGNHVKGDCAANSPMLPYKGIVNADSLVSQYYTRVMYTYERSPADVVCKSDRDCCANRNAEFLFCDVATKKCVTKVQEFGKFPTGKPVKACHCSSGKTPYVSAGKCRCMNNLVTKSVQVDVDLTPVVAYAPA